MPPTEEYDFAAGASSNQASPEREMTTNEMLARDCNAYLEREKVRRIRTLMVAGSIFILGLGMSMSPAHSRSAFRGEPLPYSCDTVRTAVKSFSPAQLAKLAKQFGVKVTASQRREAQKCLEGAPARLGQ